MASLNREKGVYFIHKSVQEYLAGNFLKEELTSKKAESTNSLLKLDSVKKIREMLEVLKFAVQLSEEAARDILIQLGMKSGLKEFKSDNETPSQEDLSEEQTDFINLCNQLFFYCSAETRKNLFPTFLSSLGGVLVINEKQLNVIVQEKLVQTTETPNYLFNKNNYKNYKEQDYSNLIILTQQLNAVIVSSAGEKKASEFLSNLTWRSIDEFFLKKEENKTHLYLDKIVKNEGIPFPCDMIKALISKQETTKKTNMNGDESSEESSSSCCSKRHGLSRVQEIEAEWVNRSEVELMSEMMQFITAPHVIWVVGEDGEVFDAEITESLLRSIQVTHKLKELTLCDINVTSSPAVEFINNVFKKAPKLKWLNMSLNPLLGAGVDSLIKHLSFAPHLRLLVLEGVKMTPQQVMDLSSAIQRHGNITYLESSYHDRKGHGNPLPEHEWPSEDHWKRRYPSVFSHSSNESQPQKQQIPAETPLSIHDSPFPADHQDTVGRTFSAPPDPTADPMLAEASLSTAHGSSHGLVPHVQYSGNYCSPDIHTHHHSAPSTIFTAGGSLATDPYHISGPGPSTVTQDEPIEEEMWPQTEIQNLLQLERLSLTEEWNLPSSPSRAYDEQVSLQEESPGRKQKAGKKRKVQEMTEADPMLAEASFSTAHRSSHGPVPHIQHSGNYSSPDIHTHHHSAPSTIFTPGESLATDPYLISAPGSSTATQDEPVDEMWPQTEIQDLHQLERFSLKERDTHPSAEDVPSLDPGTAGPVSVPLHSADGHLYPYGNCTRAPQQAPQPQSASPRDPQFGNQKSSVLQLPKISGNNRRPRPHQPQPQSASPRDPHRGDQKSSVLQLPEIPGNSTRSRLHQPQPQSASPRNPHRGDQKSSVLQLPEIPGNSTRSRLHQPQPQRGSPRNPHRGDQKSSVLQRPEISVNSTRSRLHQPQPQRGSPRNPHRGDQKFSVLQLPEISVNSTRSRLHQPQPQSGSPHDPHLGGKPSDSSTPRHLSRPRHKSRKSKPRHSSNPRHTSNSSNQRHTEAEGRARRLQVRNKPRKGKKK